MRVTIDAAILVRALVGPRGPAARLLSDLSAPHHRIVLSRYILDELERVLSYPRIQAMRSGNSPSIQEHLSKLRKICEMVASEPAIPIVLNDAKDDPVLYTAVSGKVDCLCTPDRHFYAANVLDFCKAHGIRVMNDVQLIRELLLGGAAEGHYA
jgi:putative PIN family toxin of toxin-antitoxin system